MLPLLVSFRGKLPPGMAPSLTEPGPFLWEDARDVLFVEDGIKSGWKTTLALANSDAPIRGMSGQRTATLAQILFFGTLDKLFRSTALASPVDVSGAAYNTVEDAGASSLAGMWSFVNWGEWVLASNGEDQIQIYKTGPAFSNLTQTAGSLPFTCAKIIAKLGAHVIALNTNLEANEVRWCSADDVHDWIPTAVNTAGQYTIRDLEGEIVTVVPLGERLLIYSSDSAHVMTYLGAPFVFGVQKVLGSVGAVGRASVCEVGRENFGLGRQGFFRTDGTSLTYIDEPYLREWFWSRCKLDQISKTVCYHNEDANRVEWFYPLANGGMELPGGGVSPVMEGLAYDYRLRAWSRLSSDVTYAIPREVFQYPLIALSNGNINAANSGSFQNPLLLSKALDFEVPWRGKFVSHVYVQQRGNMTLELGYHNKLTDPVTWLPAYSLVGDNKPVRVGFTAHHWRVRLSGTEAWRVGGIEFYGRGGGANK